MIELMSLMPRIWGGLIFVTIAIELATTDIDAIWFSVGSVIALFLSFFNVHLAIQLSAFVAVTAILLFTVGKWTKKVLMTKNISTNSDSLIGREILILESANEFDKGSGVINDIVWTVICQAGVSVEKGQHAIIIAIDGNKLVVKNKEEK
jgi:membrane protein implicated in regulation of membrane protease activity